MNKFFTVFGRVLGLIPKVVTVAETVVDDVAPYESLIGLIPIFGPVVADVIHTAVAIEKIVQQAQSGAQKRAAGVAVLSAAHPNIAPETLGQLLDDCVKFLNSSAAAFQSTVANPQPSTQPKS